MSQEESYYSDYRMLDKSAFLLEIYETNLEKEGLLETYHWHYEPEIVLCTGGSTVVYCNGNSFTLHKDEMIFINSSQLHSLDMQPPSSNVTCCFDLNALISVNQDECDRQFLMALKNLDSVIQVDFLSPQNNPRLHKAVLTTVAEIIEVHRQQPFGYQLKLKSLLYQLLFQLVTDHTVSAGSKIQQNDMYKNYGQLKDILLYLNRHYMEHISLQDLADIAHVSPSYFCKYFKKFIGNSPMDYLNTIRIENAAKLLKITNRHIIDIAYEVGFQNLSYFSRTFLRYKGLTPSEYRIRMSEQSDPADEIHPKE